MTQNTDYQCCQSLNETTIRSVKEPNFLGWCYCTADQIFSFGEYITKCGKIQICNIMQMTS